MSDLIHIYFSIVNLAVKFHMNSQNHHHPHLPLPQVPSVWRLLSFCQHQSCFFSCPLRCWLFSSFSCLVCSHYPRFLSGLLHHHPDLALPLAPEN